MNRIIFLSSIIAVLFLGSVVAFSPRRQHDLQAGAADSIAVQSNTVGSVWVLTTDTLVTATNTARTFLQVTNLSGATGTAQTLYCNDGDRPSTDYQGYVIYASTTPYTWNLDNMIRGAIRCQFAGSSGGTIGVVER